MSALHPIHHAWAAEAFGDVLRPPEDLSPSEFAERHRHLKEGTTFRPGLWSNEVFPYLVPIMDAIQEAIRLGKRGLVLMKSGQGGGSEAMINALLWLKANFSGPILYLISKDDLAKEFSRDRFEHAQQTCAPIAVKSISGYGSGDSLHQRRFTDGKLTICGGRSVLNLQSEPRRFVMIDEVDSLLDEVPDGDPLQIAEIRVDAFPGTTLIIAFAHPSSADTRGAGKLYYESSDQRRGFVDCPHCPAEFWLQWDHVRVEPREGQERSEAERDPTRYVYRTPCCDRVLTDAQRWRAVANGVRQQSTLPEEEARAKPYLGVHFSQLYMSNKPLVFLAEKWVEGLADPATRRVFVNKRLGEPFSEDEGGVTDEQWKALIDRDHRRGEVPEWAAFLTGGADVNAQHVHWSVWAWGLRIDGQGRRRLCGALVDWAEVERVPASTNLDAADLEVLDEPFLHRTYQRPDGSGVRVRQAFIDAGWKSRAVYEYCRAAHRRLACTPAKGMNVDSRSKQPIHRWGKVPPYVVDGQRLDPGLQLAALNTFKGKRNWFDLCKVRTPLVNEETGEVLSEATRIVLPHDVDPRFVDHLRAEVLRTEKRKTFWHAKGPNHWLDTAIYAFASAYQLSALQRGRTAKEIKHEQQRQQSTQARRQEAAEQERQRRAGFRRTGGHRAGVRRRY